MIEKRRPRRKKSRINKSRTPNQLRTFETKGVNTPKTRGAISKALEKYTSLAQDAFSNGDRIVAESYYQFAEHYQRVLNENFQDDKHENVGPQLQKENGIDVMVALQPIAGFGDKILTEQEKNRSLKVVNDNESSKTTPDNKENDELKNHSQNILNN